MTIPKKLKEKRDELAREFENYAWRAAPYTEVTIDSSYREGFNSACNLLLPEIKKLEEALIEFEDHTIAANALQSLRESLGSEEQMIQFYAQWVCTWCHHVESFHYVEGQVYLFHEDDPPCEDHFKMIVDENDFPVKVRVRE